ncbi:hypothetical protein [Hasllibacter sp. MH4015]|uniref:hypothetical protein n=1 Tax=Hasllibacter sp. MH4015 TaxID=2854029 RepID=UPI001CD7D511|nr:hypothetical protein [Hasllibacter sp. MH4015]
MTIRISLLALATLLFLVVLATISSPAVAHATDPDFEDGLVSSRILSTGPLNVVVFEVSRR